MALSVKNKASRQWMPVVWRSNAPAKTNSKVDDIDSLPIAERVSLIRIDLRRPFMCRAQQTSEIMKRSTAG